MSDIMKVSNMRNQKLLEQIITTRKNLIRENDNINECIDDELHQRNFDLDSIKLLQEIRARNIETIQYIDQLGYKGVVDL